MQESNSEVQPPESSWEYNGEDSENTVNVDNQPAVSEVSWTASEYISHEKTTGWYMGLGLAISGIALLVYVLTREVVSAVVMIIIGIAFGAFAARKPNELQYVITALGIQIGQRTFSFEEFKSFSVMEDGPVRSITLAPLQRFTLPISIYYDPTDEQKITDTLSAYLPYENSRHDMVDRLMKKIRF